MPSSTAPPTITADRLGSLPGYRLLDVRTPGEFETSHIDGAANLPLDQLGDFTHELATRVDGPLVVVCQSGARARRAADSLAEAGASDVHVLDGGMNSWAAQSRPAISGKQRWAMERQVRLVAGSLTLAGVVGSVWAPRLKYLAGGIGAGLTFSALSDTCTMARVLSLLPYNQGPGTDARAAVRSLTTSG